MSTQFFEKDPEEVLDYTFDWANELDDIGSPSDTISTSNWSLPSGITNSGTTQVGAKTAILLSSGTAGNAYRVVNTITTAESKTFEKSVVIVVVDKGTATYTTALVVEDGSVVANANAYDTRAAVAAYHAARANADWFNNTPGAQDAAIIKATAYLVQKYRRRWKGIRVDQDQTLDWPRAGAQIEDFFEPQTTPRLSIFSELAFLIPEDSVPQEIKDATAELALRALTDDLNPDISGSDGIKRLKAGSVEIEYADTTTSAPAQAIFKVVDDMVKPLLRPVDNRLIRG